MTTSSPPQRTDPRRGSVRWGASILATFISTYVLDLVATASGLLLAWSGAMSGLDHATLLGVLAVSYAGWLMGLRVNLRSNLVLLEQTGMSTNILSKAAYDLSARGSTNRRRRRLAAGLGYLLSELLKEVPYYLGALGTTALSDGLTANDALIFLAGANLGAGLYECSLSGLTRGLLSRRGYAAFETDWDPAAYLREYYSHVEPGRGRDHRLPGRRREGCPP